MASNNRLLGREYPEDNKPAPTKDRTGQIIVPAFLYHKELAPTGKIFYTEETLLAAMDEGWVKSPALFNEQPVPIQLPEPELPVIDPDTPEPATNIAEVLSEQEPETDEPATGDEFIITSTGELTEPEPEPEPEPELFAHQPPGQSKQDEVLETVAKKVARPKPAPKPTSKPKKR